MDELRTELDRARGELMRLARNVGTPMGPWAGRVNATARTIDRLERTIAERRQPKLRRAA